MSDDLVADVSLPRAWVRNWRGDPQAPALCDTDGQWVTNAELADRSEVVAGRLQRAGLEAGDRVLISGSTSAELVAAHVGALRAGLVVVPVNPRSSERELLAIAADADPGAAILGDPHMRSWIRSLEGDPVVVDTDVDLPDGPAAGLDVCASEDPALLPYTSGTTGRPKGVVLSHGNLLAGAEALRRAWRWESSDRLVLCLPLFHMHGLGVGLHGTLLTGAAAVLQASFEPDKVISACAEATMFFGVPTMYMRLVETPGVETMGDLRLCVSGSAPLSADLHNRFHELTGQRILERYGMTETVMLCSNPYEGERKPGTVGRPLPGVQLKLDETTDEILVRGPNVFSGYHQRPEATAEAFDADGWFRTGDIGSIDDEGYVSIVGRAKELIITGGYNVYPREIEDLLSEQPGVREVAIAGTPDAEWGEIVTAYIVADTDVDPAAVVEAAASDMAPYKRPRIVHRVDALPRNSMGKVVRHELAPPDEGTTAQS